MSGSRSPDSPTTKPLGSARAFPPVALRTVHRPGRAARTSTIHPGCLSGPVGAALCGEVLCVDPELQVVAIVEDVLKLKTPAVVVVDDEERPIGIVSRTDLLRAHHEGRVDVTGCDSPAFDPGWDSASLRARDVMTPTPIVVSCADSPQHVLHVLESSGVQQLPVTDERGRVAGLLGSVETARLALLWGGG